MLAQTVNPVAPNNQNATPQTEGVFNSPELSKYLISQPDSNYPAEKPINDKEEKDSYTKTKHENNAEPVKHQVIRLDPAVKKMAIAKVKQPTETDNYALAALGIVILGVVGAFFGRKYLGAKQIEKTEHLVKYAEEAVKNSKNPIIKEFNLVLGNQPDKQDALRAFVKIAKHCSNVEFNHGTPVFHIVLKETSRGCESRIIDCLNRTGDISNFADSIERIQLSMKPAKFIDKLFNKRHPIKLNVGSYCYFNERSGNLSLIKERFFKLF